MGGCVWKIRNDLEEKGRTLFHGSIPVFVCRDKEKQKTPRYPVGKGEVLPLQA